MIEEVSSQRSSLSQLAALFLRLGTTAFGGPAAHIAMMRDEVVVRRRWMEDSEFLDLVGATNLIPGPNSTELAIHIGRKRAGFAGLLVAGACFIVPAALIVTALSWFYVTYGTVPAVSRILYGVKPAIIAIVLQALVKLSGAAVKNRWLAALGLASAVAALAGVNQLVILGAAILLASASQGRRLFAFPPEALGLLFWSFAKIGSVLFGSGYVLLAFLRSELVEGRGWLTEAQLLDAVAIGQLTPGPVFTTATCIGYILDGPIGAVVATAGIFLPAFVFVALSAPLLPKLRASRTASACLDAVNAASLGLMAAVTWQLGRAAIVDIPTWIIAAASAVALLRFRVNSTWLVLGGALLGLIGLRDH